jgi:hypothetical protein
MCSNCSGDVENPDMTASVSIDPFERLLEKAWEAQQNQMRVECAWHPKSFGTTLVMREGSEPTSHGICDECRKLVGR